LDKDEVVPRSFALEAAEAFGGFLMDTNERRTNERIRLVTI